MNSLNTYFIPAPLSALLTIVSGLSISIVSGYAGKKLFRSVQPLFQALYFFAGLLVLGWTIWMFCLFGIAVLFVFQVLLYAIIAAAFYLFFTNRFTPEFPKFFSFIKDAKSSEFYLFITLCGIFLGYAILAITFPTDSDSLNYHLALPVEILKTGSIWFNKDNLHFRMAGFGEMLNLLGVANGCPQLGAFLQVIAFFYVLHAFASHTIAKQRLNLLALFLGIPVLLFLLPSQKHQLTGILATSVCFLFLQRRIAFTSASLVLFLSVVLFAAAIKYSFLISCAALILLFFLKHPSEISVTRFLGNFIVLAIVILGPQLLFKWYYFGDPLSPLLEGITPNPDPVVLKLHTYIKQYRESSFTFPINLFFTNSFAKISTILGVTGLIFAALPFLYKTQKAEVITIVFFISAIFSGGQISSRFFLEPLFWTIFLFITTYKSSSFLKYFLFFPKLQLFVILAFVTFGIYSLAPSVLTNDFREKVMLQSSNGYAESKWLDKILPVDARIATASRSRAFSPRPYFPWEYLVFSSPEDQKQAVALGKKLRDEYKITHLVLPYHGFEPLKQLYAGELVYGPKRFTVASRNPFNRLEHEVAVYKIKINKK